MQSYDEAEEYWDYILAQAERVCESQWDEDGRWIDGEEESENEEEDEGAWFQALRAKSTVKTARSGVQESAEGRDGEEDGDEDKDVGGGVALGVFALGDLPLRSKS